LRKHFLGRIDMAHLLLPHINSASFSKGCALPPNHELTSA
jgi:hypothetical protein